VLEPSIPSEVKPQTDRVATFRGTFSILAWRPAVAKRLRSFLGGLVD